MMERHFKQVCQDCGIDYINTASKEMKVAEEDTHCERCGKPYAITFFNQLQDADTIIEIAGMVLEDRNKHSITGLPRDVWDNIKEELVLFSDAKKATIARKLALTFDNHY